MPMSSFLTLTLFLVGCGSSTSQVQAKPEPAPELEQPAEPTNPDQEQAKPTMLTQENLGQEIVVEGIAANAKLGPVLQTEEGDLWIAELDSWPDGFWSMADGGKKVRVTGILGEDHSLPVFEANMDVVLEEGAPIPQGIIIPPQMVPTNELAIMGDEEVAIKPAAKEARHRYILKEAKWEVID